MVDKIKEISALPIDDIPELRLITHPGVVETTTHRVHRNNPTYKIFAAVLDPPLGEFILKTYYAAAVKSQFDLCNLTIYFRNDRPYKQDILSLNPFIDNVILMSGDDILPLDYFYGLHDRHHLAGADAFIKDGYAFPDLILTPSMMVATNLLRFEVLPYFVIPRAREDALDQRLVDQGVDPNRWFCCLYYREPSYEFRPPTPQRDVDPVPYMQLAEWIIRDCGGQVVRIGHPGMTRFPDMEGFVDLSNLEDGFMTQANAVARCRLGVVTSSGPSSLFGAFGVPFANTNAISVSNVWHDSDPILPRHLVSPQGEPFDTFAAIREGSWNDHTIKNLISKEYGYRLVDNSVDELRAVTEMVMQTTTEVRGWRERRRTLRVRRTNHYVSPAPIRQSLTVVQFPELSPERGIS